MHIAVVGLDLAKNIFQVHGVDECGRAVVKKQLRRQQLMPFFAQLSPCLIGMEACGGAHHWARRLLEMGHSVRLIAPQFVKPYVKSNKNDVADAEAIREAVRRPNMRFVPIKTVEQQAALALHRARQGFVKSRTAQANQIRGLLAEFGIVIPPRISVLKAAVPSLLEESSQMLPGAFRQLILDLLEHLEILEQAMRSLEKQILRWHRQSDLSQKLEAIPGVGPLTASALIASISDGRHFSSGRQLTAWLGLVPGQYSSGGKPKLLASASAVMRIFGPY